MQIIAIVILAALGVFIALAIVWYFTKAVWAARHGCLSDLAALIWVAGIVCTLIALIAYAVGARGAGMHIFFIVSALVALSPLLLGFLERRFKKY